MDKNSYDFEMQEPLEELERISGKHSKQTGKDFDEKLDAEKRKEEIVNAKHRNFMWFHKNFRYFVIFGLAVLAVIFFGVLPASVMMMGNDTFGEWFQAYSIAFVETINSFGIALFSILVTHYIGNFSRRYSKNRKDGLE